MYVYANHLFFISGFVFALCKQSIKSLFYGKSILRWCDGVHMCLQIQYDEESDAPFFRTNIEYLRYSSVPFNWLFHTAISEVSHIARYEVSHIIMLWVSHAFISMLHCHLSPPSSR